MSTTLAHDAPVIVDPRIAERRRSVEGERRRRRRRRLLIVVAVVGVVAGGWFLTRTSLLDVDRVDVVGSTRHSPEDVVTASGLRLGDQLLDIDGGTVADRVEALPWVDTASVAVGIDGVVSVTVTERSAVATAVDGSGARVLVDPSGRVLGPAADDVSGLVPLEGVTAGSPGETVDGAEGALQAIGALGPGARSRVTTVVVAPDGTLVLTLDPEGLVLFGPPSDLEAKATSLAAIMGQVDQRGIASIDVRDPANPVVLRNQG